jgi:nitrite reductase/ring-hydroxylating ferredoxin subunit
LPLDFLSTKIVINSQGDVVECPWHGSRFCLRDGRVLTGPATVNAPRYDVHVRNGQVEVRRISEA